MEPRLVSNSSCNWEWPWISGFLPSAGILVMSSSLGMEHGVLYTLGKSFTSWEASPSSCFLWIYNAKSTLKFLWRSKKICFFNGWPVQIRAETNKNPKLILHCLWLYRRWVLLPVSLIPFHFFFLLSYQVVERPSPLSNKHICFKYTTWRLNRNKVSWTETLETLPSK